MHGITSADDAGAMPGHSEGEDPLISPEVTRWARDKAAGAHLSYQIRCVRWSFSFMPVNGHRNTRAAGASCAKVKLSCTSIGLVCESLGCRCRALTLGLANAELEGPPTSMLLGGPWPSVCMRQYIFPSQRSRSVHCKVADMHM